MFLQNKIVIELDSQINIREPTNKELKLFKEKLEKDTYLKIKDVFGEVQESKENEYFKIKVKIKKNKLIKEG